MESRLAFLIGGERKIYENNNYHNDWNSYGAAAGVYYYLLSFPNDIIHSKSGTITIIR